MSENTHAFDEQKPLASAEDLPQKKKRIAGAVIVLILSAP